MDGWEPNQRMDGLEGDESLDQTGGLTRPDGLDQTEGLDHGWMGLTRDRMAWTRRREPNHGREPNQTGWPGPDRGPRPWTDGPNQTESLDGWRGPNQRMDGLTRRGPRPWTDGPNQGRGPNHGTEGLTRRGPGPDGGREREDGWA